MIIPLRQKYRVGFKSRFKGGEQSAPRKTRVKIGHKEHVRLYGEAPKRTLVVNGLTGTGVMHNA